MQVVSEQDYVRKGDHHVELVVPKLTQRQTREFLDAISVIEPSLVRRSLILEVYQPLRGRVANVLTRIVKEGVQKCTVWTLLPNRADLVNANDRGHFVFRYERGIVVDHRMPLSASTDHLLHEIEIEFDELRVETNEWNGRSEENPASPPMRLVVSNPRRA